jgi:hypothetical protein
MNEKHGSLVNREVAEALAELAPRPGPGLLAATLRRIASTPQVTAMTPESSGSPSPRWRTLGLAATVVVAGIAVGLTAASLLGPGQTASQPTEMPSASGTTGPTVEPLDTAPPIIASTRPSLVAHDAGAAWDRIDLPDPVPGVFGGSDPRKLLPFRDQYVLAGSVSAGCVNDIHQPPPGCTDRLAELTTGFAYQAAAVWLSSDGRAWELIHSKAFPDGTVTDAATDGQRIVVAGVTGARPLEVGGEGRAAIWTSTDGRTWEVVHPDGPVPEFLEWTTGGWIGVRNTRALEGSAYVAAGPEFLASPDGLQWEVVSAGGAHGPGHVADLAVDLAGTTALAVGYHEAANGEGLLEFGSAVAWRTRDGRSWERAPDQQSLVPTEVGGLYLQSITATGDGWLGVGRADDVAEAAGVWRSGDGLSWDRLSAAPPQFGGYGTIDHVAWTNPGYVATGTIAGPHGSVISAWVSADGSTWESVRRQPSLEDGVSRGIIADGDVIVVSGIRSSASDHWLPVVYVASR